MERPDEKPERRKIPNDSDQSQSSSMHLPAQIQKAQTHCASGSLDLASAASRNTSTTTNNSPPASPTKSTAQLNKPSKVYSFKTKSARLQLPSRHSRPCTTPAHRICSGLADSLRIRPVERAIDLASAQYCTFMHSGLHVLRVLRSQTYAQFGRSEVK